MANDLTEYPPTSFYEKYQKILAPGDVLLSPKQVFGNTKLGNNVEVTIRKAFKITIKKLKKLRSTCATCNKTEGLNVDCENCYAVKYCSKDCLETSEEQHAKVCKHLKLEQIDQVVECLPFRMSIGSDVLRGRGGVVSDWNDWFTNHTVYRDNAKTAAALVSEWWALTPVPHPGLDVLQDSMERLVSNIFSTVLTIGHCFKWVPSLESAIKESRIIHIHLLGADQPEVVAVEKGIIQVAARVLKKPIVVSLVAPDLKHHPQTCSWTPEKPHQATPSVRAIAYPGLYHDFWREHVASADKNSWVQRPHIALAIHPGVHTDVMLELFEPTLMLLAKEEVPFAMTTYNSTEFEGTIEKLEGLKLNIVHKEQNPFRSLHVKQTPYNPNHVWAANSYAIAIDNSRKQQSLEELN